MAPSQVMMRRIHIVWLRWEKQSTTIPQQRRLERGTPGHLASAPNTASRSSWRGQRPAKSNFQLKQIMLSSMCVPLGRRRKRLHQFEPFSSIALSHLTLPDAGNAFLYFTSVTNKSYNHRHQHPTYFQTIWEKVFIICFCSKDVLLTFLISGGGWTLQSWL